MASIVPRMKTYFPINIALCIITFASATFFYIHFLPADQKKNPPASVNIDTGVLSKIRASLKDQKNLTVFEGLPHQGWEAALLKSEIASKDAKKIHGFHFYSKALTPNAGDLKVLIKALSDEDGIIDNGGWVSVKLCGGYHPDYAVQWTDSKGGNFHAQICFGCHEIKIYSDNIQLHADLNLGVYKILKKTLTSYGDQRPK